MVHDREFVDSADGTRLRLVRLGEGPPVVLVHGTAGGKGDWLKVARRLSESFEVITFDRRGRGDSGDGSDYSLTREVEDILAVIEVVDAPVRLVGHSFGAILCMLAAPRTGSRVNALVLYEPPLGLQGTDDQLLERLDATIASGDLNSAIRNFAAAANITIEELGAIETSGPAWAALRDGVRVAGREIRAAKAALPFRAADLARIAPPTLILVGADQRHPTYTGVRDLVTQVPAATLTTVPGRHLAITFAADAFVDALRTFFATIR